MNDRTHELEEVGRLTVTDEHGETHTCIIRREDLTGTNGAYRAVRDAVVETLRDALAANRGTGDGDPEYGAVVTS